MGISALLLFLALPAAGRIYKWVDDQGQIFLANTAPEWWQESFDELDYTEVIAPADSGEPRFGLNWTDQEIVEFYRFIGDTRTKFYFDVDCKKAWSGEGEDRRLAVPTEFRAFFHSLFAARRAGFSPSPDCQTEETSETADEADLEETATEGASRSGEADQAVE